MSRSLLHWIYFNKCISGTNRRIIAYYIGVRSVKPAGKTQFRLNGFWDEKLAWGADT